MASTNSSKKVIPAIKPFIFSRAYFWIPFMLAIFLRLRGLTRNSFWYDESFTVFLTRKPLLEMVHLISLDFHPPLWEILEWFMSRLFGESELSYRFLSLAASLGTLWVIHKILKFFDWSKLEQFIALLLAAILPYQAWMAQDARVYALLSFLYLLAFYYILKTNTIGFIGAAGLMLYANNAAPFYVFPLILFFLFRFRKKWRTTLLSLVLIISSFLPWLVVFWRKIEGSYFIKPALDLFGAVEHLAFIFAPRSAHSTIPQISSTIIFAIIILFLLVALLVFLIKPLFVHNVYQADSPANEFSSWILIGLLPLILIALASLTYKNVFFYRSLSMVSLPLILCVFVLLRKLKILGFLYAILLGMSILLHWAFWSPMEKGGYLKEEAMANQTLIQSDDVFFHATSTTLLPFSINFPLQRHVLLDESLPPGFLIEPLQQAYQLQKLPLELVNSSRIWIVWADDPELPDQVHQRMKSYTQNAVLKYQIVYPHASRIDVFFLEK